MANSTRSLPPVSADSLRLAREIKAARLMRRLETLETREAEPSLSGYRSDPAAYAREVLGVEPWERQRQIMRAVADYPRVTVRACHNSGKSWLAGCLIHWWGRCFMPSLVVTTARNVRQVRDVLWQEVKNRQLGAQLPGDLSLMKLTVSPSQRAHGLSTNEPV